MIRFDVLASPLNLIGFFFLFHFFFSFSKLEAVLYITNNNSQQISCKLYVIFFSFPILIESLTWCVSPCLRMYMTINIAELCIKVTRYILLVPFRNIPERRQLLYTNKNVFSVLERNINQRK